MATDEDPAEFPSRMRRAIGRLNRRLRQTRAGAQLSPSQYEVLATIVGRGPLRHADLAVMEGLNPTMLSRIIGKLEATGLVARLADAGDGRVVHVAATKRGRDLVARIRSERSDALSVALKGLSDDERQRLMAALPVLESLVERLGDPRP
ncbi:MAG: MarR family winged helix-turn-helix transcriptional regulator [Acidimicrobiales bacterium]